MILKIVLKVWGIPCRLQLLVQARQGIRRTHTSMIGLHSSSTIDPQKHIVVESTKLIRKKLKTGPSTVEVVPDDEDCRKKALEALSEFACLQLTRQECLPSIDKVCRMATNASMAAMLNEQKTLHGNLTGCLEILSV